MEKVLKSRFTKNQNTPMTPEQYEQLSAIAKANDVNRADVMRTALAMFLETHGDKQ